MMRVHAHLNTESIHRLWHSLVYAKCILIMLSIIMPTYLSRGMASLLASHLQPFVPHINFVMGPVTIIARSLKLPVSLRPPT